MSKSARPAARPEWKYKLRPSKDNLARASNAALLTSGPTFVGTDQGAALLARVETHRSRRPTVPGRSESRKISSPSRRIAGRKSFTGLLSSATRTAEAKDPSGPSALE